MMRQWSDVKLCLISTRWRYQWGLGCISVSWGSLGDEVAKPDDSLCCATSPGYRQPVTQARMVATRDVSHTSRCICYPINVLTLNYTTGKRVMSTTRDVPYSCHGRVYRCRSLRSLSITYAQLSADNLFRANRTNLFQTTVQYLLTRLVLTYCTPTTAFTRRTTRAVTDKRPHILGEQLSPPLPPRLKLFISSSISTEKRSSTSIGPRAHPHISDTANTAPLDTEPPQIWRDSSRSTGIKKSTSQQFSLTSSSPPLPQTPPKEPPDPYSTD